MRHPVPGERLHPSPTPVARARVRRLRRDDEARLRTRGELLAVRAGDDAAEA